MLPSDEMDVRGLDVNEALEIHVDKELLDDWVGEGQALVDQERD